MELMDMKDYDIDFKEKRTNGYLIATLFIIVGILFLLRNLGMIDPSLFDLLVSWPMLLVVSGIFTIFHRNPVGGMLLVGVGVYFLFPQLNWITNDFLRIYWPLGLILLGLVIMLKRKDSIRTKSINVLLTIPLSGTESLTMRSTTRQITVSYRLTPLSTR